MSESSTREKILQAAQTLFVEHGFAGTSMGNIAKLADVNHSLIFHYFDNKQKLWLVVKQNLAQMGQQQSKIVPETSLPFPQFLSELIKNSMHFYRSNSDIVRMINWQRLERNKEKDIGVTLSNETQLWLQAFKSYQKNGEISSHFKAEFIITLILSVVSSAVLDPNSLIRNKKEQGAYIDFCVKFIQKALAND